MKQEKRKTRFFVWFIFALFLIIIFKSLDNFSNIFDWLRGFISILMPFIVGVLLAYLLYIPCKQIERLYMKMKMSKKIARPISVFTVYLLGIILIVIVINIIIPIISKNVIDLAQHLPGYYQTAKEYINNMPEDSIIKKESIQDIITNLESIDITKIISLENIADYIRGVVGIASGIFNVFVTFIMSVYVLLERSKIVAFIQKFNKAVFKENTCKSINKYFFEANNIFFKYISAQVLDAIVVGVLVSIVLAVLGVDYAILLGVMIGLFNIIPYFGSIIAVAIASIITLFTGGFAQAIWMLIIVIIVQQIDANIINPRLVGASLKISPILIIFSVTILGAYWGVLGMFLAVPIIAVIKLLVVDFVDNRIEKKKIKE